MLILYRKKGDSVLIGDNTTITVMECGNDGVRLAIDAPRDVSILRKELVEAAKANREAVKKASPQNKDTLHKMNELLKKKEK